MATGRVRKPRKFNAVDLITVVVFAALVRVLFVIFKLFGVVFPFNHAFLMFFSAFCLAACLVVVRKKYSGIYFTVGWVCINFFLQGEVPHYFACIVLLPLLPEFYLSVRSRFFKHPDDVFRSLTDVTIYSVMYNVAYFLFNFAMIVYVFLIPVTTPLFLLVLALAGVFMTIGSVLGFGVGKKIMALIG